MVAGRDCKPIGMRRIRGTAHGRCMWRYRSASAAASPSDRMRHLEAQPQRRSEHGRGDRQWDSGQKPAPRRVLDPPSRQTVRAAEVGTPLNCQSALGAVTPQRPRRSAGSKLTGLVIPAARTGGFQELVRRLRHCHARSVPRANWRSCRRLRKRSAALLPMSAISMSCCASHASPCAAR